ncbi:putative reverse transcriptase domain-containing protein [Tanacetum coccineum]
MVTRSQSGIVKPVDRLSLHTSSISPIPKSSFLDLKDPHCWNAMYDEYYALVKNSTWILVPRPSGVNLVRSMWLFKHKFHADRTLSYYKAPLVANSCYATRRKYALQLLERAHMVNCNPSRTLVDTESKLGPKGVPLQDSTLYRSLAGGLHAEAKYRGVVNVVTETAWIRNLLRELNSPLSTSTLDYCDNGSATAIDLLKAITSVINLLLGEVAMKGVDKEMSKYLSDFQFRVRVSGCIEAVLHCVNRLLSEYHNDGSLAMLTVDFSNAFNLMDRSALLQEVRVSCKLLLYAWYLDGGTIIGDPEEVAWVLDIINVSGPGLGLELNIKKTEIFWPSCNGVKLREGLFLVNIRRPSSDVKLLGRAVSRDINFISRMALRRSANAADLMSLLP